MCKWRGKWMSVHLHAKRNCATVENFMLLESLLDGLNLFEEIDFHVAIVFDRFISSRKREIEREIYVGQSALNWNQLFRFGFQDSSWHTERTFQTFMHVRAPMASMAKWSKYSAGDFKAQPHSNYSIDVISIRKCLSQNECWGFCTEQNKRHVAASSQFLSLLLTLILRSSVFDSSGFDSLAKLAHFYSSSIDWFLRECAYWLTDRLLLVAHDQNRK